MRDSLNIFFIFIHVPIHFGNYQIFKVGKKQVCLSGNRQNFWSMYKILKGRKFQNKKSLLLLPNSFILTHQFTDSQDVSKNVKDIQIG